MWQQIASADLRALAYSLDGRTLFTVEANRVLAWNVQAKKSTQLFQIDNPYFDVTKAEVTADGRYLVLTTRSGGADCVVWDVTKGERRPDFQRGWSWLVPAPTGCEIRFMGKNQMTIRIYDPDKGKERKFIDVVRGLGKMTTWALSPDDKSLLMVDSKRALHLQNVATSVVSKVKPPDDPTMIDKMTFSPDGKSVALLLRHGIEIRNAADMSVRVPKLPAPDAPWSFAFHPRAQFFAGPNAERDLTLYDLDTGKPVRDFKFRLGQWTRHVVFAPDGSSCAACGNDNQFAVFEVDQ